MAIVPITKPFAATESDTGQWMRLLEHHDFQGTAVTLTGTQGWPTVIPYFVLMPLAAVLAWAATPALRLAWRGVAGAAAALGAWALLAAFAPRVLGIDHAAELKILAAGDRKALLVPYGPHPISHLAMAGFGVALVALL